MIVTIHPAMRHAPATFLRGVCMTVTAHGMATAVVLAAGLAAAQVTPMAPGAAGRSPSLPQVRAAAQPLHHSGGVATTRGVLPVEPQGAGAASRQSTPGGTSGSVAYNSGAISTAPVPDCAVVPAVSDRCPAWSWTSPDSIDPYAPLDPVIVAPDRTGDTVYSAYTSADSSNKPVFTTVALRQATGEVIWTASGLRSGDARWYGGPVAIAVDPRGRWVAITGDVGRADGGDYAATVAYDARTGRQLWLMRHELGSGCDHGVAGLVASPDGSRVYVSGTGCGLNDMSSVVVAAYDALTGDELWTSQYARPPHNHAVARGVTVSPDGAQVYVVGTDDADDSSDNLVHEALAIGLDTRTGAQRWVWHHAGAHCTGSPDPTNPCGSVGPGIADAVDANVDGTRVYVVAAINSDQVTFALNPMTGRELWSQSLSGSTAMLDVAPDDRIYEITPTTGQCATYENCILVTSLDGATGRQRWSAALPPGELNAVSAHALAPDGRHLYVGTRDTVTGGNLIMSVDTTDGAVSWSSRYLVGCENSMPTSIVVTPDSRRLDAGSSTGCETDPHPAGLGPGPSSPIMVVAYDAT